MGIYCKEHLLNIKFSSWYIIYTMRKTRNIKKRGRKTRKMQKGGYWFYPGPGDEESVFTKASSWFSGKKGSDTNMAAVASTSEETTEIPASNEPTTEVKEEPLSTNEPTEVTQEVEATEVATEQAGGKRRRKKSLKKRRKSKRKTMGGKKRKTKKHMKKRRK